MQYFNDKVRLAGYTKPYTATNTHDKGSASSFTTLNSATLGWDTGGLYAPAKSGVSGTVDFSINPSKETQAIMICYWPKSSSYGGAGERAESLYWGAENIEVFSGDYVAPTTYWTAE